MIKKLTSLFLILITVFTVSVACQKTPSTPADKTPPYIFNTPSVQSPTNEKPELTYTDITLLSAGDIMYHMPQVRAAYNSSTGKYDFSDNFKYMKPIVSAADYAVVNFETTTANQTNYTSYPAFNSPLAPDDVFPVA